MLLFVVLESYKWIIPFHFNRVVPFYSKQTPKQGTPLRKQRKTLRKGMLPCGNIFPQIREFLLYHWKDIESQWISALTTALHLLEFKGPYLSSLWSV